MNRNRCNTITIYIFLMVFITLSIRCSRGPFGGSEVQNERVYIFMPDGVTPAPDVQVYVVPIDYLPGEDERELYMTTTNAEGWCTVHDVSFGTYNILAAGDSLVCILESVSLDDGNPLPNGTLEAAGDLFFSVKMQPNHDPRSVTAQILGTPYYQSPDSNGFCRFTSLSVGSRLLRLKPGNELYTSTICMVAVQPPDTFSYEKINDSDTVATSDSMIRFSLSILPDMVIELPYIGIPVPTGLNAAFDPVNEMVAVTWDTVRFDAFNDYVVYRDTSDASQLSTEWIGSVTGNIFIDTLSQLRGADERICELRYRVAVRDTLLKVGETFGHASVTVKVSPLSGQPENR